MLLADFIREGENGLSSLYPEKEAHNIILMLCENLLGIKRYTHIVEPGFEIPSGKLQALLGGLDRLKEGEPVQYVLGHTVFCGFDFRVSPAVLIPRPETEMLVELLADTIRTSGKSPSTIRILDLCTGSGCIAWSLSLLLPGVVVSAVDISEEALAIASSQTLDPLVAPVFICGDLLGEVPDMGSYDYIVSNPPYIMESEKQDMRINVLNYEPSSALFVPDNDPLLFYRALEKWAEKLLVPGGKLFLEINERLGDETAAVFSAGSYKKTEQINDFFGKIRFIIAEKSAAD